jgi:L-2-hydroxyglutarate oxidase LhgO
MSGFDFDAVVVGAGAVGLACGYALARRGQSTVVLEAGPRIGEGVSARNSEVIHGGLYYPTGSLKARLCVTGRRALYAFLEKHGIAYHKTGKLVVATNAEEVEELDHLHQTPRSARLDPNHSCYRAHPICGDGGTVGGLVQPGRVRLDHQKGLHLSRPHEVGD